MEYNHNFLIAMVLSLLVLFGWHFFFTDPQKQIMHEDTSADFFSEQRIIPQNTLNSGQSFSEPITMTGQMRKDVLIQTKRDRIEIDTPQLSGSINIIGSQIDDISLKNYRETVEKDSSIIALLNPEVFKQGYFVEFGFISPTEQDIPRNRTQWHILGKNRKLTPSTPVCLAFDNGRGLIFHRTISVDNEYMFTIQDSITNTNGTDVSLASYGRVVRNSEPETDNASYLLHEGMIGVIGDEGLKTETYSDLSKSTKETVFTKARSGWIGITDKYWAVVLIPLQDTLYNSSFSFSKAGTGRYQSDFSGELFSLKRGETKIVENRIFIGAKQVDVIGFYESKLDLKKFELLIDWGWLYFFTKPMFLLIDWLFHLVGNFGVAILLVTVLLKIILFPLANKSYKSMARMKKIQPLITELREKYVDDRNILQQKIMDLYRHEKVNPFAGCWPMIIQFPIFFALYKVLYITIEMRHAPFFGWILDLASPDPTSFLNLFGLLPYAVPQFLTIGFWPIIMGITMFLQMRMSTLPVDPTQAMIFNWMPLFFTWMLSSFPVGLVIYWAWNNTLSIIQQAIIMKFQGVRIELFDNLKFLFSKEIGKKNVQE